MKINNRVINNILNIVSFFLLIITLVSIIASLVGFKFSIIMTDSMKPTINPGDIVIVIPKYLHKNIDVGDIVLYKITLPSNKTIMVLHRVIDIDDSFIITKGDNRDFRDPWKVPYDNIIGVFIFRIPRCGTFMIWFARIFIILSPLILGFIWYITIKEILHILMNKNNIRKKIRFSRYEVHLSLKKKKRYHKRKRRCEQ